MPTLETLEADAVSFFTFIEGWAVNQHQRTNDAGFAALARLAGKFGAVFAAPENAADIAAVKAMAAQDFAGLASPAKPAAAPAFQLSSDFQRDLGDHAHGNRMDPAD